MRADVDITNFTAGELSPRMKGRIDHKGYYNGCDKMVNMVVLPQGGATQRPGTLLAALTKDQAHKARLIPFIFSTLQAYVLEFSNTNARVYMNRAVVLNGGVPVDIATPYLAADLPGLKFTQSADTLFLTHNNYPPATLTRSSNTVWTYTALTFKDGPYLDINTTTTTLTPSGTSGAITLTASSIVGINNDTGFNSGDVGRAVRIKLYSHWAWCIITAITSTTVVSATVQAKVNNGADALIDGAPWSASTDYTNGTVVSNGGNNYIVASAGRSGANGPHGAGSSILDGSVIWTALPSYNAVPYQQSTLYDVGDIVFYPGQGYYQCETAGKSNSGGALSGTGFDLTDTGGGTLLFNYLGPFSLPTATKNWALGVWCPGQGYPSAVRFWQERLFFAGTIALPNRIDGSQTGDFTNMAPSKADGTVLASNALDWTIDDDQVNAIHWLVGAGSAQAMQLGMGTLAGEHILQAATTSQALSPTSVQAYSETAYGSVDNVAPLRIGKAVLFADRTGRKLREWAFYWQNNGYTGPDKLQYSEHITKAADGSPASANGIAELAYQQSPYQVIWMRRNDGALVGMTYDRDQDVFAPHRHQLGGNYYGGAPVVEGLTVIPSHDGTYDELWLTVLRTINGAPTRTMEVMAPYFDGGGSDNCYFVDCGLQSALIQPAGILSVSGLTNSADAEMPAAFTGTAQLTVSGGPVFTGQVGSIVRVNSGKLQISAIISPTQATANVITPLASVAPAASASWSMTPKYSTFSGLSYLNGETVAIWGDGADLGTAKVTGGSITLSGTAASFASVGLNYTSYIVSMPWEPVRAAAAATQGKMKTIDTLYARFHETRGAQYGRRTTDPMTGFVEDKLTYMEDREAADQMDSAPPLQSGIFRLQPLGDYDQEGQLIFVQSGPSPLTITAVFARGQVAEMPRP